MIFAPAVILPPEPPAIVRAHDGMPSWAEARRRARKGVFPFPVVPPIAAVVTPLDLGAAVWHDVSDLSSMRQDSGGASATVPAAVDFPVGSRLNKGTYGGWTTCSNPDKRPILRLVGGKYRLEYDGVDDAFDSIVNINSTTTTIAVRVWRTKVNTGYQYIIAFTNQVIYTALYQNEEWGTYNGMDVSSGEEIYNVAKSLILVSRNHNDVDLWTDGVKVNRTTGVSYNPRPPLIGGAAGQYHGGYESQIVGFDRAISDAEATALTAFLHSR